MGLAPAGKVGSARSASAFSLGFPAIGRSFVLGIFPAGRDVADTPELGDPAFDASVLGGGGGGTFTRAVFGWPHEARRAIESRRIRIIAKRTTFQRRGAVNKYPARPDPTSA